MLPELLGAPREPAPATELLPWVSKPGVYAGAVLALTVDVSVAGQMVVDTGTTEVYVEAEPDSGQLATLGPQL